MAANPETRWGRGYLIMESFTWQELETMLNKLLCFLKAETWEHVTKELNKELNWEFENYQQFNS